MALIIRRYLDYFVYSRLTHSYFERGYVSYFDPIEREFLRIAPFEGEVPQAHWIPLPVIKEADAFRNYLRLSANTTLLEDYASLDDLEFCVQVVWDAERYAFEDALWGYVTCYYNERLMKWVEDNNVPNCKISVKRAMIEVHSREDAEKVFAIQQERILQEELQEEDFKRSLHQKATCAAQLDSVGAHEGMAAAEWT